MEAGAQRVVSAFPVTGPQLVRFLVGILWLGASQLWFDAPLRTGGPGLTLIATTFGLVAIGGALWVHGEEREPRFDLALVSFSALFLLFEAYMATSSPFGSDVVAFTQQAAGLLLHGHNPYTANYAQTFATFGVTYGTPTLAGHTVTQFPYPSGSFLLLAPFVFLVGLHSYAYVGAMYLALMAALLIFLRQLPQRFWAVFALLLMLPLVTTLLFNDLDFLYMPFLLLAFLYLERFRAPAVSWMARWLSPVLLGLACTVKQNPWFLVPFAIVMVVMAARQRGGRPWRAGMSYLCVVTLAFLAINLPFVVWNPGAWLTGFLNPLTTAAVPFGIGAGTLILLAGTGDFTLFGVGGVVAYAAALLLYIRFYARLKPTAPVLAVLPFLLTNRNPAEYFVLAPFMCAYLLAVLTPADVSSRVPGRRSVAVAGAVLGCASLALVGAGLAIPPPLSVQVDKASATKQYFTATVEVVNRGSVPLSPHFVISVGIIPSETATVLNGPGQLGPGQRGRYVLRTPDLPGLPGPDETTNFEIDATTTSPSTIAISPPAVCDC